MGENAVARHAAIEMRYLCTTTDHGGVGYSQTRRESVWGALDWAGNLVGPAEMDCSSAVAAAVSIAVHEVVPGRYADLHVPMDTWTGNMIPRLTARGWADIGDSWTGSVPDGGFRPGDLLLVAPGHVAMAVYEAPGGVGFTPDDPLLAEAQIDAACDVLGSDGDDGSPADDTGWETRVVRYSDHPYTHSASWSTCLRYTGPDTDTTTGTGTGSASSEATPPAGDGWVPPRTVRMTGIDVSSHQAGLDVAGVPCDVVVVKATEGVGFADPGWRARADAALAADRCLGLYHFARNDPPDPNDPREEANWFVSQVDPYVGRAVLVLDWEAAGGTSDTAWALAWLTRVRETTGVTPMVYTSASVVAASDWDTVSSWGYPLWVAGYPDGAPTTLATPDCPWDVDPWGAPLAWQYTSEGRVPGWDGDVDLDVVYTDPARWAELARPGWVPLETDGVWGRRTAARIRQVLGVAEDAPWETACRALQYALSWQVDAYRLQAATGTDRVPVTGVDDAITWGAFQAWWNASGVPEGHRIPVTGQCDEETIRAVQITLNHSWAGSRGLAIRP
ncbi:GH25 family lysozyme [Actinomyces sp. HMT897]|uniref:GH25 family lysozyme n=1 Tax=Actinomyces sp. HMT897 TaxID=2789424 RepID=UPI00190C368A|nr:GH25 family lysozyme [Actinomyces sp. HMT897]QQO78167.1 hypothetical protein JJJ15_02025 [Actinomyces sp. HMT897]